jgi:hypothetical protein
VTIYAWPGFPVRSFELRIQPNVRTFVGPYTPTVQVLDLLGERWQAVVTLAPAIDDVDGAAREAFFDRLKAQSNGVAMGHLKNPTPLGTLNGPIGATWTNGASAATWSNGGTGASWTVGGVYVLANIDQLASTATISTVAGATVKAGRMLGMGQQLVRVMANATADSSGRMLIEFQPRARTSIPNGTAVVYDQPTANFILKPGTLNVPTNWTPDFIEGASFELIEVY